MHIFGTLKKSDHHTSPALITSIRAASLPSATVGGYAESKISSASLFRASKS
jgi:hypothetical protein